MASPSVVLTYIAVAHDMPIFLAGILTTVSRSANMFVDLFGGRLSRTRLSRALSVAVTDLALALCFVVAISVVAFGSKQAVIVTLILTMFCIGVVAEIQSIIFDDLIGDTLKSKNRTRMKYLGITIGGFGTILFAWPIHELMVDHSPLFRHSTIILIAIMCFVVSASIMMLNHHHLEDMPAEPPTNTGGNDKSFKAELRLLMERYRSLAAKSWFLKYLTVRMFLLTANLALPFFAILAALAHHETAKGLTALVISSALALAVAGPLWKRVSDKSHRQVMVSACLLCSSSGMVLVVNHFTHWIDSVWLHAAALFLVTVASQGAAAAGSLFYLDVAPKDDRLAGMAISRTMIGIFGIGFSVGIAALAHMKHVVWVILLVALVNALAAAVCYVLVSEKQALPDGHPA